MTLPRLRSEDRDRRAHRTRRRGAVTLEMATLLPVLIVLTFAVLEGGVLTRSSIALHEIARDGARAAARGMNPSAIDAYLAATHTDVDPETLTTTYEYRQFDEASGTWGAWQPLGTVGSFNNAQNGDMVRVSVTCDHELMVGDMFAAGDADSGSSAVTLTASTTASRE